MRQNEAWDIQRNVVRERERPLGLLWKMLAVATDTLPPTFCRQNAVDILPPKTLLPPALKCFPLQAGWGSAAAACHKHVYACPCMWHACHMSMHVMHCLYACHAILYACQACLACLCVILTNCRVMAAICPRQQQLLAATWNGPSVFVFVSIHSCMKTFMLALFIFYI